MVLTSPPEVPVVPEGSVPPPPPQPPPGHRHVPVLLLGYVRRHCINTVFNTLCFHLKLIVTCKWALMCLRTLKHLVWSVDGNIKTGSCVCQFLPKLLQQLFSFPLVVGWDGVEAQWIQPDSCSSGLPYHLQCCHHGSLSSTPLGAAFHRLMCTDVRLLCTDMKAGGAQWKDLLLKKEEHYSLCIYPYVKPALGINPSFDQSPVARPPQVRWLLAGVSRGSSLCYLDREQRPGLACS